MAARAGNSSSLLGVLIVAAAGLAWALLISGDHRLIWLQAGVTIMIVVLAALKAEDEQPVADQPLLRLLPEDLAAHNDCTGVSNVDLADRLIAGAGMLEMATLHACPSDPGEALATLDWYVAAQFEAARRLREVGP